METITHLLSERGNKISNNLLAEVRMYCGVVMGWFSKCCCQLVTHKQAAWGTQLANLVVCN